MPYNKIAEMLSRQPGVEISTMMQTPCLRYEGDFVAMMFDQEDSLIAAGTGQEFNFTKKRFKEWALIPRRLEDQFEAFILEALDYVKSRKHPN
jgi:hypothetical protein